MSSKSTMLPAIRTARLFDMDITTNRVDAMNHYGIAREIAAIYDVELHKLDTTLPTGRYARRAVSRQDRRCGWMRPFHGAGDSRCDRGPERRADGALLRRAGAEVDLECGGRDELRAAGHGAPDACLRSR